MVQGLEKTKEKFTTGRAFYTNESSGRIFPKDQKQYLSFFAISSLEKPINCIVWTESVNLKLKKNPYPLKSCNGNCIEFTSSKKEEDDDVSNDALSPKVLKDLSKY